MLLGYHVVCRNLEHCLSLWCITLPDALTMFWQQQQKPLWYTVWLCPVFEAAEPSPLPDPPPVDVPFLQLPLF